MNVLDNGGLEYYNERLLAYLMSLPTKVSGVESFNGRDGSVSPQTGDYTASMVGAVPTTRTINGKALSSDITLSASDVSALPASTSYVPTTRTVNGKALSSNITLSASDVSAVPTTRTINGKALSSDITLSASDIGALTSPVAVADGGTGKTTASSAIYGLTSALTVTTQANLNTYSTTTYIPCYRSTTGYRFSISTLLSLVNASSSSGTQVIRRVGTGEIPTENSPLKVTLPTGWKYVVMIDNLGSDRLMMAWFRNGQTSASMIGFNANSNCSRYGYTISTSDNELTWYSATYQYAWICFNTSDVTYDFIVFN